MRIIGHRGAKGLELENTLAGLRKAMELGVDAVEFDVRLTRDRQVVLAHDANLFRVSGVQLDIAKHTLAQLRAVTLLNGEVIPTLTEALKLLGGTPIFLEPKVDRMDKELLAVLDRFPKADITITTFQHKLARRLAKARPEMPVFLAEHFHPTTILRFIRQSQADGLTLNAWLLNPYTYWIIRNRGLKLMVYTVNSRFVAWFIGWFYPGVIVCTDHPERFVKTR